MFHFQFSSFHASSFMTGLAFGSETGHGRLTHIHESSIGPRMPFVHKFSLLLDERRFWRRNGAFYIWYHFLSTGRAFALHRDCGSLCKDYRGIVYTGIHMKQSIDG